MVIKSNKLLIRFGEQGFSLIETLFASAIFMIVASAGVTMILHSFALNKLGQDVTQATLYSQEGLEAARSLHRQSWSSLVPGTYGLTSSNGYWQLNGTSDTQSGFTRQVTIAQTQRDGSGNIVESGGTTDANTVKITSRVQWNFSPTRNNNVTLNTYLTNWQKLIGTGGLMVYADYSGDDDVIRYLPLGVDYVWGTEQTVPDVGVPLDRDTRYVKLFNSPTRTEKMLLRKHAEDGSGNDTYLYAQVWNGSSWDSGTALTNWSGATNPHVRNLDGGYLANGNFLLVYSDNTTTLKYRVWNGSTWSAAANVITATGTPLWVSVEPQPGTNQAMVTTLTSSSRTQTSLWNGSTWSATTIHATATSSITYDSARFVWNKSTPTTGYLMFNEAIDNNPNIRTWNGTTWSSNIENIDLGATTHAMEIYSYPTTNAALGCTKFAGGLITQPNITCLRTDGTPLWANVTNGSIATITDSGVQRTFSMDFNKQSQTLGLMVYVNGLLDKSFPKFRTFNPATNSFGAEAAMNTLGTEMRAVEVIAKPNSDDMIVLMSTLGSQLWIAGWNGQTNSMYSSTGLALSQKENTGGFATDYWFDFAWDTPN